MLAVVVGVAQWVDASHESSLLDRPDDDKPRFGASNREAVRELEATIANVESTTVELVASRVEICRSFHKLLVNQIRIKHPMGPWSAIPHERLATSSSAWLDESDKIKFDPASCCMYCGCCCFASSASIAAI